MKTLAEQIEQGESLLKVADLLEENIRLWGLLMRTEEWFKANYSLIYQDKDTMKLWEEIERELKEELKDGGIIKI